MMLSRFDIDIAKCMYCGLCRRAVPDGLDPPHVGVRGADYSLESMLRRFVKTPVVAYKPKRAPRPIRRSRPFSTVAWRTSPNFAAAGEE